MTNSGRGLLQLHIAIIVLTGTTLFSKLIPLPAIDITFWRCLIASLTLLLGLRLLRRPIALKHSKDLQKMLFCGALMGVHWITFFHAMQLAGVASGIIALFTYPVITVFLEPLFEHKKPAAIDIGLAALVLVGIVILVPEIELTNSSTQGICWGVFSAFMFALRNVCQRHWLGQYSGDISIFYQAMVAALVALPLVVITAADSGLGIPAIPMAELPMLLLLGVAFTALPHGLFANSLRYLPAKTVAMLACLQPVYGVILAWWVLGEQPNARVLLGGAIVVLTAAIETYRKR